MYSLEISENLHKKFLKLSKKNKKQMLIIKKKIDEIQKEPTRFKTLIGDMKGARRVHIDSSFVLTFEIHQNTVRLLDYDHHDKKY